MVHDRTYIGAYKMGLVLKKWENGRTPEDGEPDEVIVSDQWYEADGTEIWDPERIAFLEQQVQEV